MTKFSGHSMGLLLALSAAACWGGATVMSKGALADFSPVLLLVVQIGASVCVLWSILSFCGRALPSWKELWRFAWLGLLEPGLAYLLGLTGLVDTTAGAATLILTSESLMIMLLSYFMLGERVSIAFAGFAMLSLSGLPLALGIGGASTSFGGVISVALLLGAALSAAFYVVLSSRFVARQDPLMIVACQQMTALVFALLLLPMDMLLHGIPSVQDIGTAGWLFAALSGVLQYAAAFSLYLAAMQRISTGLAGMFLNFVPIFGLAGAYLFLGETLSLSQIAGATLTIGALLMLNIHQRRAER
jgi:drug/metabolite transporter (DMT)-like permease